MNRFYEPILAPPNKGAMNKTSTCASCAASIAKLSFSISTARQLVEDDTGAMSSDWRNSATRRLLEKELRNRSIPLEGKAMGTKAVFQKYQSCPEFQGVSYDKAFQRRLGALRKQVKENEEDQDVNWDKSAAKSYLKLLFEDGVIPIDYKDQNQTAQEVFDNHCAAHESFEGVVYNSIFKRRLEGVCAHHNSKKIRQDDDLKAFKQYREKYPVRSHNDIGLPRWEGSDAEKYLKKDIKEGKHAGLKPDEFRATRPTIFGAWPLPVFRNHIYQELRLRKFHNEHGEKAAGKTNTS